MTNKVALIGAGAMGGAIGTRLVETGNHLTVFDLDTAKVRELVDKGALPAASAAEAAAGSDYVILSLNSAKIVRLAVFGEGGVAGGARPGTAHHRHVLDRPGGDEGAGVRGGGKGPALGRQPPVGRRAQGIGRTAYAYGRRQGTGCR